MDHTETIVNLAKPVRKGLFRLIFSRFFIFALLIILQIGIAVTVYLRFQEKLPTLLAIQWIFVFVMIVYLFNSGMDSSAKLTWMLFMSFLPIPGAVFLWWTQSNFGHRMEKKMVAAKIQESRGFLEQPENVLQEIYPLLPPEDRELVSARIALQKANAREWRDVVNTFFHRLSGMDDLKHRKIYD